MKLCQAFNKATATWDHVAIVQHVTTPQGHPVNDQSKISHIQRAETIALSNLSKAAAASALLSHRGSGNVGVLLPAVRTIAVLVCRVGEARYLKVGKPHRHLLVLDFCMQPMKHNR
jgi:hypothetical protein